MTRTRSISFVLIGGLAVGGGWACGDDGAGERDAGPGADAAGIDAAPGDGPLFDGSGPDAGPLDAPLADASVHDAGADVGPVDGGEPSLPDTGSMFGLARDPEGVPISGARWGDDAFTGEDGLGYGDATPGAGGFVRVDAEGFAPGFATRTASLPGRDMYEVVLTPVGAGHLFRPGESRVLFVGDPAAPRLSIELSDAVFDGAEVIAEVTRLEPIDVGPLLAPAAGGDAARWLRAAFALTARDAGGAAVELEDGASVELDLAASLSPDLILRRFDAVSGTWVESGGSCARLEVSSIRCTIDRTSSLFGVFDVDPPDFLGPRSRSPRELATAEADYKAARARYDLAYGDWQAAGGALPAPDAVTEAVDDLADAARRFADEHPSEAGKSHLASAASAAAESGAGGLADGLMSDAGAIADAIADRLIDNENCGRVREMLLAAEQCQLMGSLEKSQQLIEKIRELLRTCRSWRGTIRILMFQDDVYAGLDEFTAVTTPLWTETHDVMLNIDPESGVVEGESGVTINLGSVRFENRDPDSCCGPPYIITLWGEGSSSHLLYTGTFDLESEVWTFLPPQPHQTSGSAALKRRDVVTVEIDDDPCQCQTVHDHTATITSEYTSVMVHGFLGTPLSPTLEEMLNTGARQHDEHGLFTVRGFRKVALDLPEGAYALDGGAWVSWSFIRVTD